MGADSQFAATGISEPAQPAGLPASARSRCADLYRGSKAEEFGFSAAAFESLLAGIARRFLAADASAAEIDAFLLGLKIEELVLARACAAGHEKAWELFLTRYREKLYDAAYAIAREESVARELADSVYADLYGTTVRDGVRVGKLNSYSGRGSLEGWLRTVLAQEFINRYRSQRRLVSLEEKEEAGTQIAAPAPVEASAPDPRLAEATAEALRAISGEDRLILAAYFLDGRKLAEIGRMLRVHESTISRRLDKITAGVRKAVTAGLRARGMSRRQVEEALEADVRDLDLKVREFFAQDSQRRPFSSRGESAAGEDRR
ncbi:MAG TPA: sigma-70 family RNA polymerase sigma factor [Terriglobales bacterium]|nr:sigma-70 family RNA polymerase sigma factor [Terriglobales bacterium]